MIRAGRFDQAEAALRLFLQGHAGDCRATFLLALAIQKQKRYSEASVLLDQVLEQRCEFAEAHHVHYLQGWAAYHLGD
ncbi:MAG: hypothetical protein JNK53_00180, partial [Phycisphaerae bacterium]|nr:hypothetical protein [Phycisphaerae bacterium]